MAGLAIPTPARGDVLVATNGERFVGKVIDETADTAAFESEPGAPPDTVPRPGFANSSAFPGDSARLYCAHQSPLNPQPSTPQPMSSSRPASATTTWIGFSSSPVPGSEASSNTSSIENWSLITTSWTSRPSSSGTFGRCIRPSQRGPGSTAGKSRRSAPSSSATTWSWGPSGPSNSSCHANELLGLTPSGSRGMRYWSGHLSLGLNLQSGNNKLTTLMTSGELARRSPNTDLVLEYLGNYSPGQRGSHSQQPAG